MNTNRSGLPNYFAEDAPPNYHELIKPTRVKNMAALVIQCLARGNAGREHAGRVAAALKTVHELEGVEAEEEDEHDDEYNAVVEENERLEEERVKMMYEMMNMRKELESLKSAREGADDAGKKHKKK